MDDKRIILILVFGLIIGFLVGQYFESTTHAHEETSMDHHMGEEEEHEYMEETMEHRHHEKFEVLENAPNVDLVIHEDPKSGYNAQIVLENFEFAPESASLEHVDGQGHAHIYINDKKISRVYSQWFYISTDWLLEGENEVKITLSTNDHREYSFENEVIFDLEILDFNK